MDRDVDTLTSSSRIETLLSTLAVCGWAGFTTLAAYQIPNDWIAMTGGMNSIPVLPSYQQGSVYCGQPGKSLCPNQYLNQLKHTQSSGVSGGG